MLTWTKTFPVGQVAVPATEQLFRMSPVAGHIYGGKPVVDFEGEPLFPELAIVEIVRAQGWDAWWLDAFGSKREPLFIRARAGGIAVAAGANDFDGWRAGVETFRLVELPKTLRESFEAIRERVQLRIGEPAAVTGGCWDVVSIRSGEVRFIESKWHDEVLETQSNWLQAALSLGFDRTQFLIVHGGPAA